MSAPAGQRYALESLHHGESAMVGLLEKVADRHRADHEVHHVALDLAMWSTEHVERLAKVAAERDVTLSDEPDHPSRPAQLAQGLSSLIGRRPEPGMLLIEDLRDVYLHASSNSLGWELLAQHAQAARDAVMLELASECHPKTLRQVRWANTMLKVVSPQVLTSL